MMRFALRAAVVCVGLTGCPVWAASFDCAKAATPQEHAICGDPELSQLDGELAAAYRGALAKLPQGSAVKLRGDQREWNGWLATVCRADKATDLPALAKCMLGPFRERTDLLGKSSEQKDGVLFLQRSHYIAHPESNESQDESGVTFPGFGTLQAEWPEAQSDDAAWAAWNAGVIAYAHELAGSSKGESSQTWKPELADGGDYDVALVVKSIHAGRVTVAGSQDGMGHGAAHPNESFGNLIWLLPQRRALRAEDVFAAGSRWKAALALACWHDLKTTDKSESLYSEVNGPSAKPLLAVVGDVKNWTLGKNGLTISYPEYAVSPRSSPVDDTTVAWRTLQPYLAAGFTP